MKYWFTTHWPLRTEETRRPSVWIKEEDQDVINDLNVGDLVLVYESKKGPTRVKTSADDSTKLLPCLPGKEGVIAAWEVTALCQDAPETQDYLNRPRTRWCRRALALEVSTGFVPRTRAADLLGHKPNYNFHGYGTRHSGIKKITEEVFSSIRRELD